MGPEWSAATGLAIFILLKLLATWLLLQVARWF